MAEFERKIRGGGFITITTGEDSLPLQQKRN